MSRSQYHQRARARSGIIFGYKEMSAALTAVTVATLMSGCAAAPDQSFLKVESGDKTLLDVRKNANDNVQIEVGMPRTSVAQRQADAEVRLDTIESQPHAVEPSQPLSPLEQQHQQQVPQTY